MFVENMRKPAPATKIACLLVVFALLNGCQSENDDSSSAPERPDNVPNHAEWSGGVDGGSWFSCEEVEEKWHYNCLIYDDYTGKIEDEGQYVLVSSFWDKTKGKAVIEKPDSLTLQYDSFDGDTIWLLNSFALVRKDKLR